MVKRLMDHLNHNAFMKVVDELFISKLRYGLQLYGKVRKIIILLIYVFLTRQAYQKKLGQYPWK